MDVLAAPPAPALISWLLVLTLTFLMFPDAWNSDPAQEARLDPEGLSTALQTSSSSSSVIGVISKVGRCGDQQQHKQRDPFPVPVSVAVSSPTHTHARRRLVSQ